MAIKTPSNPTLIKTNPIPEKYTILFAPELINNILKEGKVVTYRFGNKYDYLKVGDEVDLREYGSNKLISKAQIVNKKHTTFGELPLKLEGHEVFISKNQQRKLFSKYYNYIKRPIKDADTFLILSFKLIKPHK